MSLDSYSKSTTLDGFEQKQAYVITLSIKFTRTSYYFLLENNTNSSEQAAQVLFMLLNY